MPGKKQIQCKYKYLFFLANNNLSCALQLLQSSALPFPAVYMGVKVKSWSKNWPNCIRSKVWLHRKNMLK